MSKVAKIRRFMGMSQTDLANVLQISLQAYYKKEKGKTAFNDGEKIIIKNLFSEDFPEITMEELFFNQEVSKVENEVI